ncbi:H/ACA ribonucleoprotein complex subunit 2-like protein [Anthophora plagiata]
MGDESVKMDLNESVIDTDDESQKSYEGKLKYTNRIAKPMAPRKLIKKICKCIKKASIWKTYLRVGLKDVQKQLRKGEKGLVVFAGDVFPIEIMCHLPIVCEDKNIPYCYVPSKRDIGKAMEVQRGSLVVLIKEHEGYKKLFEEIKHSMLTLSTPL